MKLTPIKVRGKRGKAASSEPTTSSAQEPAEKRTSRLSKRLVNRRKSLLERQLPLEIIEHIFVLSENLNFPRCSPLVGRLLSGRSTLVNLVIAAFHPTWDCWFGLIRCAVSTALDRCTADGGRPSRRVEDFPKYFPGDPEFQSSVISCPWMNVDVLLEAQQIWARRFARTRWYSHYHVRLKDEHTEGYDALNSSHDRGGGFGHFDASACFEYDWLLHGLKGAKTVVDYYVDVHPRIVIPDHLITGPWTLEQLRLLFWLRRGGAKIQPESQNWEILVLGLQSAVTHRNPGSLDGRLIHMLILLQDFFPVEVIDDDQCLWPLEVLEAEHAKVRRLVDARNRSNAGPLIELTALEKLMMDCYQSELDFLTSRPSRHMR